MPEVTNVRLTMDKQTPLPPLPRLHDTMHQQAAAVLWTLTVLTNTVGMNNPHPPTTPNAGRPSQHPQQPGTTDPAFATPPQQHAPPQPAQTPLAPPASRAQQQQQQQQSCGPIHPAGGWPATSGGTLSNPVPITPWLPPWVASQHNTGGYTPMQPPSSNGKPPIRRLMEAW